MMNPEIRDLWVDALNSGEYTQGYGALRKDDNFCCLGVLSDLAVKAGVIDEPVLIDSGDYQYDGQSGFLSPRVAEWAGLNRSPIRLINMNDGKHNKFKTIAKYIKENL